MKFSKKIIGSKKRLIIDLIVLLALVLSFTIIFWSEIRDLSTLKRVDDYPLYKMQYRGDYKFDKYLEKGVTDNISDSVRRIFVPDSIWNFLETIKIVKDYSPEPANSCSTVFTENKKGEKILGRNFDWINRPIMLLETKPENGLSSFSMVDISYLGFHEKHLPDSFIGRSIPLISSPYVAFDGMNEMGLAVGEMAVPNENMPKKEAGKITIGDTHSIRMILDKAKNVDEALVLLKKYNIEYPTLAWHYLIADGEGNSSIIEYVDGEMVEIKKDRKFQICTNFIVYNKSEDEKQKLCERYKKAYKLLDEKDGDINELEMMQLLKDISQGHTMWSVVYNMTTGDILVVPGKKYNSIYQYKLKMKE